MRATRIPASTSCGKASGAKVIALRLYDQAYRLARMNVQRALLDQMGIHRRIEPAVIDDVVDVPVDVVVRPARADASECRIGRTGCGAGGSGAIHSWRPLCRRPNAPCPQPLSPSRRALLPITRQAVSMQTEKCRQTDIKPIQNQRLTKTHSFADFLLHRSIRYLIPFAIPTIRPMLHCNMTLSQVSAGNSP